MRTWLGCLFVSALVAGCTEVKAPPPPDAPRILSFESAARVINAEQSVRLSFTTSGATLVTLTDDRGQSLQLEGTVDAGGTEVSPSRTTFYVLRASGPGGVTNAFLQIAVNEPLREAFLVAVPPELEAGQSAQLLWSAPGSTSVTLTERGGAPQTLTGTSGIVSVTPATSTGYRLTAQGVAGTPPVDALAEVRVKPAIVSFDFTAANGVRVGEPLSFTWTTRSAARLTISERTLGHLTEVTAADELESGSFDFVVPAAIPSGMAITDGFPLRFTLTASSGEEQTTRELSSAVGNLPSFESVTAPAAVSAGRRFTLAWRTLNASRVTVELGGLPIFETLPAAPDRAANGSVSLPSPSADADYVLIASDERGQSTRRTIRVRLVPPPTITTFTVPASVPNPGAQVTARWETTNAERVTLRLENGPTLTQVTAPSMVRMGSSTFTLGSTAAISLEAFNAAGDVITETRVIRVFGSPVTVSPVPALRSTTGSATLDWQLSALNVTETIGLASTAADGGVMERVNAMAFIDLTASSTATPISFADPGNGSELVPQPDGFSFPLAGQRQNELWVSANGFIAFTRPATLPTNADLGLSTNTTQSMLAPFWDDLTIPATGKVLTELMTSPNNERFIVVQWDKVKLNSAAASELTFQVHMYETGQVTFAYKTLTAPGSSFTVGVKVTHENVRQRFVFNTSGGPLVEDHELQFFIGGPPNGTMQVPTSSSRRINFFGRTATGLVPFSAELRTVAVNDLVVTEAMPFPEASVAATGQWVEIKSNLTVPFELEGITLASLGSTSGGGTVLPPRLLMPGEYLVIGQTTDTMQSGGAPVRLVMNDVPLGVQDSVRLLVQDTAVASLSWDGGTLGESIFVPEGLLVSPGSAVSCPRSQTFGPNGAFGTPGLSNEICSPYVISRVDAGYIELNAGAVELLASESHYTGIGTIALPAPFTYFGQPFTSFNLSLGGGFLTFGPALTGAFVANPTAPATTEPNGVVAPFWDEIVRNSGADGDGSVRMQRFSDRTVISWQDFRIYADYDSHINFQVHLIDPDIVEFHYGSIETTSTVATNPPKHRGSTATIWLEDPQGTVATPFSVNEQKVSSFMPGVRFTPAP